MATKPWAWALDPSLGAAGYGVNVSAFPNSWKQHGLWVGEGCPLSRADCEKGETKIEDVTFRELGGTRIQE